MNEDRWKDNKSFDVYKKKYSHEVIIITYIIIHRYAYIDR